MTPPRATAGVGNDQTRRHNLSTVLTMLHHDGAQSRAELTRRTGLNRSTIAALVAELADLGLAFETAPVEPGTVGRPSPFVHPNDTVAALTINPDIDAITLGLVGLGGKVHKRVRYETAGVPSVRETINISRALVQGMQSELDAQFRVIGVGLAVPGLVRVADGVVTLAPHLMWQDEPLAGPISEALGFRAYAANDAGVGTLAESVYGAGRGISDFVYLNGSASGIGGGVVIGGKPLRGAQGYAGELGHTVVNSAGERCFCGRTGCLETVVNRERLLTALGRSSSDADQLDQLLSESTSAEVVAEVRQQVDWLAVALGNLIGIFNPAAIILGGFLASLLAADPERLRNRVAKETFEPLAETVRIQPAQLGPQLLTVGAAELAFAPLLADPATRH